MTRAAAHDRPHQENDDRGEGTSRRDQTERRARAPREARGRRGAGGGAAPRSGRTWEAPKGHGLINVQPPYGIGQPGRSDKGAEPINNVLTALPSIQAQDRDREARGISGLGPGWWGRKWGGEAEGEAEGGGGCAATGERSEPDSPRAARRGTVGGRRPQGASPPPVPRRAEPPAHRKKTMGVKWRWATDRARPGGSGRETDDQRARGRHHEHNESRATG